MYSLRRLCRGVSEGSVLAAPGESQALGGLPESLERGSGRGGMRSCLHGLRALRGGRASGRGESGWQPGGGGLFQESSGDIDTHSALSHRRNCVDRRKERSRERSRGEKNHKEI